MANNVTNELTFKDCSKERFREILEAIQRDDIGLGSIDFHKIIPQPSFRTDKECIDWRIKNWNTKWEAYGYRDSVQYDEDKQQIRFLTANRSARKIILALSRQYPDVLFELRFADENFGFNVHGLTTARLYGSSMYTAINASSTEQFLVGCINDSIYFHFRYVVSNNI